MKVMTLLGSPRKGGNTATVLEWVEETLRENRCVIDRVDLVDYKILPCRECYRCQQVPDEPGCTQMDDDAVRLFRRMMASDVILLASPLFCWSFTAPVHALLERCYCLVSGFDGGAFKSLVEGKRLALLMTSAGPVENNNDLAPRIFERAAAYLKCEIAGQMLVPFCTDRQSIRDEVRGQAAEFARQLSA